MSGGKRVRAVEIEKTGSIKDQEKTLVQKWAESQFCNFPKGADLEEVRVTVLDFFRKAHPNESASPELPRRALGTYLKQLVADNPSRFERCLTGWKCAPPLSYLVSESLPDHKVFFWHHDSPFFMEPKRSLPTVASSKKEERPL